MDAADTPLRTLYLKGIKGITSTDLGKYMEYYGEVMDVHMHEKTGEEDNKDFAFVQFKLASAAVCVARNTPHYVEGKSGNKCTVKAQLSDPNKTIEHHKKRAKGWGWSR